MAEEEKQMRRLKKNELLGEAPICGDTMLAPLLSALDPRLYELYTHDVIEIGAVTSGSGIHRVPGQSIPCKEGDIYITSANVPHGYFSTEREAPLTVRRLWFDLRDWFDGDLAAAGDVRYCYGVFHDNPVVAYAMLTAETKGEINGLLDRILRETEEMAGEWRDLVRAALTQLLITVSRYINRAIKEIPSFASKEWGTVLSAIRVMTERFDDASLTLAQVADTVYVSQSHLSRLFTRLTGEGFSEYLRGLRIRHACRLLKETSLTVEEIAYRSGLRDLPSFYRAFRTLIGMTPKQYRLTQQRGADSEIQKKGEKIMVIMGDISANLQQGRARAVKELVQQALQEGASPERILNEGLLHGMGIIGEKFKNNEVYVPEVLVAARAMNMGAEVLKPHLAQAGVRAVGRVCIGTVRGDLHDIGKNLVRMMMEGKGLEVIDLGTDVSPDAFIQTAIEQNCQVICCSALLTTTMDVMGEVVAAAERAGIRDRVRIMVGGAPVTEDFCRKIGADCYTADAASAADAAVALCLREREA